MRRRRTRRRVSASSVGRDAQCKTLARAGVVSGNMRDLQNISASRDRFAAIGTAGRNCRQSLVMKEGLVKGASVKEKLSNLAKRVFEGRWHGTTGSCRARGGRA